MLVAVYCSVKICRMGNGFKVSYKSVILFAEKMHRRDAERAEENIFKSFLSVLCVSAVNN